MITWVKKAVSMGAGEVLLTSVDREGTRNGYDVSLVNAVSAEISVPVIASGGMGNSEDLIDVIKQGGADAIAMADILHYNRATIGDIRGVAQMADIEVRAYEAD